MGFASSSAARIDETSMFGNLGSPGGGRKLKKKPVLVLDPEELAKAHQLFQIGAAEQIGEFDPLQRAARAAPIFGTVLGAAVIDNDDDDDYVPPFALDDEEEVLPEDDLPPIDLTAILALTSAEQAEEDAFYAAVRDEAEPEPESLDEVTVEDQKEEPTLVDDVPEPVAIEPEILAVQPKAASQELELSQSVEVAPRADTAASSEPAEALARIISRAALQTPLVEMPEADSVPYLEPTTTVSEPEWHEPEPIEAEPLFIEEQEPLDLGSFIEDDVESFNQAEIEPVEPQALSVPVFEASPRSELRARLVREELTLAHPEPSAWRKFMIALRRMWRGSAD